MQKAAIKVKDRDSGDLFLLRYFYPVVLLYHNLLKMSTVWVNFEGLHKIKLTVLCK